MSAIDSTTDTPAAGAIRRLRAVLAPNTMLYFIFRHSSRSGRQEIAVMHMDRGAPVDLSASIAVALDLPIGREHGVIVPAGLDDPPRALSVRLSRACGFDQPFPVSWL